MAVGMTRAVDSAIGLPSSSTSASWMLGLWIPAEVSRSFMVPFLGCPYGGACGRSTLQRTAPPRSDTATKNLSRTPPAALAVRQSLGIEELRLREEGELGCLGRAVRLGDLGLRAEGEAGAVEAVDGAG